MGSVGLSPVSEILISSVDDLNKLGPPKLFNRRRTRFKIFFDRLSAEENVRLTDKVNDLYSVCGCGQGRIAGVIALCSYVVMVFTGVISIYKLGVIKTVLLYFAWAMLAMMVGKTYGIWQARRRFRRLVTEIVSKY